VCFERPNYFCGHLLTDADLTLQQKYVVEKNKLYHRTMDGYGIVCGLKLTCDCDCKGNILIHDGFAIDDCGNDLIVCETTRFDVIGTLKKKGLLVYDPPEDDCEPKRRRSRCEIKQCFYITICYNETESDYETPFQSSCTSGPKQCMPTRTHEGVRFDVTDKLPPWHSQCEELIERFRECFELNCDSQVGSILKKYKKELLWIFGEGKRDDIQPWQDPCELFCTLRAYFLNYLKVHPDRFNCNLYDEVCCLRCPGEGYDDDRESHHRHHRDEREGWREREKELRQEEREERRRGREEEEEEEWRDYDRKELQEAFRKLLYYMQRYQYDCVLGDVVFNCQQPCEAHCLVLGTVEVLNGKLVRVCNTPRKYLMAPANLLNVLIYDIMTPQLHPHEGCRDKDDDKEIACCCPDYDKFHPGLFVTEFGADQGGRHKAATSLIRALCALPRSLHDAFDFTDSMAISSEVLATVRGDEAREVESRFGITAIPQDLPAQGLNPLNPMQTLQSYMLLRRRDAVVAYQSKDGVRKTVTPSFWAAVDPDREIGTSIQEHAAIHYDKQISELKKEIEDLRATVGELRKPGKRGSAKDE